MLVTSDSRNSNTAHHVGSAPRLRRTAGRIATRTRLHTASAERSRTLAHFIVRQPRGLIAAALQYGHVSAKVTLSYAGRADTTWLDDLTVEKLEMVLDQAERHAAALQDGEHVSDPSAAEYRIRVGRAADFAGRTVTGQRNAARLLAAADPGIHHGEAMTCVWRAETAACRDARIAGGRSPPRTDAGRGPSGGSPR